jgi:hypothetical protein
MRHRRVEQWGKNPSPDHRRYLTVESKILWIIPAPVWQTLFVNSVD